MISKCQSKLLQRFRRQFSQILNQDDKSVDNLRGKFAAERIFQNLQESKPKKYIDQLNEKEVTQTLQKAKQFNNITQQIEQLDKRPEHVKNYYYIQKIQDPSILLKMFNERKFYFTEYNYVSLIIKLVKLFSQVNIKKQDKLHQTIWNMKNLKNKNMQDLIYTIKQNFRKFNIGVQLKILADTYKVINKNNYLEVMQEQLEYFIKNKSFLLLDNKKLAEFMLLLNSLHKTDKVYFKQCDKLMQSYLLNHIIKKEKEPTTPELIQQLTQQKNIQDQNIQIKKQEQIKAEDNLIQLGLLNFNERQLDYVDDFQEEDSLQYLEYDIKKYKAMYDPLQQYLIDVENQEEELKYQKLHDDRKLSIFTTQKLIQLLSVYFELKNYQKTSNMIFDAILQSPYFNTLQIVHINILLNYASKVSQPKQFLIFKALYNNHFQQENFLKIFNDEYAKYQSQYIYYICKMKVQYHKNIFRYSKKDKEEVQQLREKILKINDKIFINYLNKGHIKTREIAHLLQYIYLFKPEIEQKNLKSLIKNTFYFSKYFQPNDIAKTIYQAAKLYKNEDLRKKYNLDWDNFFNFLMKKLELNLKGVDQKNMKLIQQTIYEEIPNLKQLKYIVNYVNKQLKNYFKYFVMEESEHQEEYSQYLDDENFFQTHANEELDKVFVEQMQYNKDINLDRMVNFQVDQKEAEVAKNEIVRCIKEYEMNQMRDFDNQMQQKLEFKFQQQEQKLNDCESFWNEQLKKYDNESQQVLQHTEQEQEQKREEYFEEQKKKILYNGKFSKKFLDLQYKLELLSKNQRFEEAAKIQKKLEKEHKRCLERNKQQNEKKLIKTLERFQKKQQKELDSLKQRIEVSRNEILISKEKELRTLQKNADAKKAAIQSKINLIRGQKLKFLQAFDPEKNINVSNVYAKYINYQENSEQSQEEDSQFSDEYQNITQIIQTCKFKKQKGSLINIENFYLQ